MSRDRGEANALGLVLIAPMALALAMLVLWVGRKVDSDARVQAASAAAAQAAALQRSPAMAVQAARRTASLMLADTTSCSGAAVSVDVSQFHAGGTVTVAVECSPMTADLALAQPSPERFTARSTAAVDPYRAGALP